MPRQPKQSNKYTTRSFTVQNLELRLKDEGLPTIHGLAAVFNSLSEDLGGFKEKILPGAFKKTIQDGDIRALLNYNPDLVLGRTKADTLRLEETDEGLSVEIDPPDTQVARDLVESMKRGDIDQMSFGFIPVKQRWIMKDKKQVRELLEVRLFDVSPVTFPAYKQTTVSVRSVIKNQARNTRLIDRLARIRKSNPLFLRMKGLNTNHSNIGAGYQ